jgi:hypothetical protein
VYAANAYVVRMSTPDDETALRHLAALDSQPPLEGPVMIGEIRGTPVAALSLADDRVVADPFIPTAHLLATMRVRSAGVQAIQRTPSLRERLLAGYREAAGSRAA